MITANIRNWHRRNTGAAMKMSATLGCSNGGSGYAHVQLRVTTQERGTLHITLTPDQAAALLAELTHCSARYVA